MISKQTSYSVFCFFVGIALCLGLLYSRFLQFFNFFGFFKFLFGGTEILALVIASVAVYLYYYKNRLFYSIGMVGLGFAVPVFAIYIFIFMGLFTQNIYDIYHQKEFRSSEWIKEYDIPSEQRTRIWMVQDLLEDDRLNNKDKAEIFELLGTPDSKDRGGCDINYQLGKQKIFFLLLPFELEQRLCIKVENGKTKKAYIDSG
jgi:hypothetical protein